MRQAGAFSPADTMHNSPFLHLIHTLTFTRYCADIAPAHGCPSDVAYLLG